MIDFFTCQLTTLNNLLYLRISQTQQNILWFQISVNDSANSV